MKENLSSVLSFTFLKTFLISKDLTKCISEGATEKLWN